MPRTQHISAPLTGDSPCPATGTSIAANSLLMGSPTVVWVGGGSQAPGLSHLLEDGGARLSIAHDLAEALPLLAHGDPDVVLITCNGNPTTRCAEVASTCGPATKILLVASENDLPLAPKSKSDDVVPVNVSAQELYARVVSWAKIACLERRQQRSLTALADRVVDLERELARALRENQELRELAHKDELTSLGNRRSFRASLDFAIEYAARYGGQVSVIVADLDGMKAINDLCGHPAGDAALRRIAEVFRSAIRGVDHAARLGGDEFGVVMPATPSAAAGRVAERIRAMVDALVIPGGPRLSASFGVATLVSPARGVGFAGDELFARADAALYAAKRAGKNRVELDHPAAHAA